jgi:hypothetical protein
MKRCTASSSTAWSTGWREGTPGFSTDAHQVRLSRFGLRERERFTYEYDFVAGWRVDIRVEKILPRTPGRRYPACAGGARQAPPETCCGVRSFLELRQRWPLVLVAARMAEILTPLLDSDGDQPIGTYLAGHREELTGLLALARLDEFDKSAINARLHALGRNRLPASGEEETPL